MARLFTPKDTAVQTPNSDTPYSFFGVDLRTEPFVITVPEIEKDRYFSIQLVDAYTHNFAYIGSRTTGNGAANYLLAGPGWKGEKPPGIKEVIPCETNLALGIYRTQLFNPDDMAAVKKIQDGYRFQPLSKFLGQDAPPAAPKIDYVRPITLAADKSPLEFFGVLNFVLSFCPTVPSEQDLMARFAKISVGAGKPFDPAALSPKASPTGGTNTSRSKPARSTPARSPPATSSAPAPNSRTTTSAAWPARSSASTAIPRRRRCIPSTRSMPRAGSSTPPSTATPSASPPASCRRSTPSGRSRCTTCPSNCWWTTRSTAT
jgi:hypothetical protein